MSTRDVLIVTTLILAVLYWWEIERPNKGSPSPKRPGGSPPGGSALKPHPMVTWIGKIQPALTKDQAEQLWDAIRKRIPAGSIDDGRTNSRLLMLSLAFEESSWRFDAVGDGGASLGLYQMKEIALEDIRLHQNSSFPVTHSRLFDPDYATWAAWEYLQLNLRRVEDGWKSLDLALTMHNTGPTNRALARQRVWWGLRIIERAWKWQKEAPIDA